MKAPNNKTTTHTIKLEITHLRRLAALAKDLSLVPSIHIGYLMPSSGTRTYMQIATRIYTVIK